MTVPPVGAGFKPAHNGFNPIRSRVIGVSLGAFVVAMASCVLAPLFGSTSISLTRAFDWSQPWAANVDAQVFFIARLPRVREVLNAQQRELYWQLNYMLGRYKYRNRQYEESIRLFQMVDRNSPEFVDDDRRVGIARARPR